MSDTDITTILFRDDLNKICGKFWVVTHPTKLSIMDDIMFEADVAQVALQVRGGLTRFQIVAVVKSKEEAEQIARITLDMRDKVMAISEG